MGKSPDYLLLWVGLAPASASVKESPSLDGARQDLADGFTEVFNPDYWEPAAQGVELWSADRGGEKKLWVLITEPCNRLVEKLLGRTEKTTVMAARVHM